MVAMSNYERIKGAQYSRWLGEEEHPVAEDDATEIEEMYREGGRLIIRADTSDGLVDLAIPITAEESWNEFVDSLPKFES